MKPPIVYLDTSFFIGYYDDPARKPLAKQVMEYEIKQSSRFWTSILTLHEFVVRAFDLYKHDIDCEEKVQQAKNSVTDIAQIYGMNDLLMIESARLLSAWGEFRKIQTPPLPRDKKFRWDAIHLATAHILKSDRVYAFDSPWEEFPKKDIPNIGAIIHPANFAMLPLFKDAEKKAQEEAEQKDKIQVKIESVPEPVPAEEKEEQQITPSADGDGKADGNGKDKETETTEKAIEATEAETATAPPASKQPINQK